MVCKIVFCSEFPDIPDNAEKGTRRRRRRRRTQAIGFHTNAISVRKDFANFTGKYL